MATLEERLACKEVIILHGATQEVVDRRPQCLAHDVEECHLRGPLGFRCLHQGPIGQRRKALDGERNLY